MTMTTPTTQLTEGPSPSRQDTIPPRRCPGVCWLSVWPRRASGPLRASGRTPAACRVVLAGLADTDEEHEEHAPRTRARKACTARVHCRPLKTKRTRSGSAAARSKKKRTHNSRSRLLRQPVPCGALLQRGMEQACADVFGEVGLHPLMSGTLQTQARRLL